MQNKSTQPKPPQTLLDRLSIGKASEYLGVSIDTLRRWEKKGVIIAYRSPGGHRYFLKNDLDKLFGQKYTRVAPTKKGEPIITPSEKPEVTDIPKTKVEEISQTSSLLTPTKKPAQPLSSYAVVQEIDESSPAPPPPPAPQVTPPPQAIDQKPQQGVSLVSDGYKKEPQKTSPTKVKKDFSWSTVLLIGLILFAIADIVLLVVYFTSNNTLISPVP